MKLGIVYIICFFQVTRSQNISTGIGGDQDVQSYTKNQLEANPFLSATLSATVTCNSAPFHLDFDSTRRSLFSTTLTKFLTKIFDDQQVYDLKILSVSIFDDDGAIDAQQDQNLKGTNQYHTGQMALEFSMVVSAEYTNESQVGTITTTKFSSMLQHVCYKFQSQLMEYLQKTGDPYFMDVKSIVVGEFLKTNHDEEQYTQYSLQGMPSAQVHLASIIAIVVGGILFIVLSFASLKLYGRAKQLHEDRLSLKYARSCSTTNASVNSSSKRVGQERYGIVPDDYSFNPIEINSRYNVRSSNYGVSCRQEPIWPESSPPGEQISYTDELRYLPKQHVFAPPGKIGVAIDMRNGQPVVSKVRRGSLLERMLQHNDIIVAIDDEDTSCLSTANVRSMMAKRIDRVRKITFVRRID